MDRTLGYGAFMGDRTAYIQEESLDWLHEQVYYNKMYITVSDFPDDRTHLKNVGEAVEAYLNRSNYEVYRVELALTNEHPLVVNCRSIDWYITYSGCAGHVPQRIVDHQYAFGLDGTAFAPDWCDETGWSTKAAGDLPVYAADSQFFLDRAGAGDPGGQLGCVGHLPAGSRLINAELRQHTIIPLAIILQIVIAIAVPQLAGISPVLRGASKTVQEAVSGSGQVQNTDKKGWIDRRLESIKGISRPIDGFAAQHFPPEGTPFSDFVQPDAGRGDLYFGVQCTGVIE